MNSVTNRPQILESFFENKQTFTKPWVDRWSHLPNPFLVKLVPALRPAGVELSDFSANSSPSSLSDVYLNVTIRPLNAAVRITLDSASFVAANPNWPAAPELIRLFDQIAGYIREAAGSEPGSQEAAIALHLADSARDLGKQTASLLRPDLAAECMFGGVSIHKPDSTLVIDKSLQHKGAAFLRVQRSFGGSVGFADMARHLLQDEIAALRLLGVTELP